MSHGVNVQEKSDRQLSDLQTAILKEQALRRKLDASPEKIEHAIAEYQKASGKGTGEQWEQPVTALQAYRAGAEVEDDGKHWVSTVPNNVWRPGVSGWRLKAEVDPETGKEIPPPYMQPSGSHDAYQAGEKVTFEEAIYTSLIDGNVWSPADYPDGWELEPAEPSEPDPDPDPPEDDEEPADPDEPGDDDDGDQDDGEPEAELGTIDNPFTWSGDAAQYKADQYVIDDGVLYRVRQGHTSQGDWTPEVAHSLYERL